MISAICQRDAIVVQVVGAMAVMDRPVEVARAATNVKPGWPCGRSLNHTLIFGSTTNQLVIIRVRASEFRFDWLTSNAIPTQALQNSSVSVPCGILPGRAS